MKYFENFVSNTYAGSGNQLILDTKGKTRTGRLFYKISVGGEYDYSLLFSNIIDSTYSDGSLCHNNAVCDSWIIHSAKIGQCKRFNENKALSELTFEGNDADIIIGELYDITFNGQREKAVMPAEFFCSDPTPLQFEKNDYLCLEITFSGKTVPYHMESLLPVYINDGDGWKYSPEMPFAGMIGCRRSVKGRIGYIGDSITQGIGAPYNSYLHWNAVLSRLIGDDYAYWNLGLGFGRASDAASDGAWLFKAKQNDVIFVCYGVNDLLRGHSEEKIKADLNTIVNELKKSGKTVILQTIPPFDYAGDYICTWNKLNEYIKTELKDKVDAVFDNVPYLGEKDRPHMAKFGGHPNAEGCKIWAEALYEAVKNMF